MAGYIGSKSSVTQVDGYNQAEADAEFVNDPNSVITVSGSNVGIGTTSPTSYAVYGYGPSIELSGGYGGSVIVSDTSQTNKTVLTHFGSSGEGILKTTTSKSLHFSTNDSEPMMTLDSSGNLLVGTTSASGNGVIVSPEASGGNIAIRHNTGSSRIVHYFINTNGLVGNISISGSSTSYNTSSDYRLKTDAQPMTGASARVQALNPVNFEWIADGTRVDGFLAHEAQAVVPEAVTGTKDAMRDEEYEVTPAVYEDVVIPAVLDEDGNELEAERTEQQLVTEAVMGTRSVPDYQGIDQSKLVPLLTAALQEALTKIDTMETRLAALEAV